MSAPKFTPGPWSLELLRYDGARIVAGEAFDKTARAVAWVSADETEEDGQGRIRETLSMEAIETAHLIAAAPELYAACEAILKWATASALEDTREAGAVVESKVRSALAKARGES